MTNATSHGRRRALAHYDELARIGKVLSSPVRLRLLDLLRQGSRNVDELAEAADVTVANSSRHLQQMRSARLVHADREGKNVRYRIADEKVSRAFGLLRGLAESLLPEMELLRREMGALDPAERDELLGRILRGEVTLVDTRPVEEYRAGHLPGARSIPLEESARTCPGPPSRPRGGRLLPRSVLPHGLGGRGDPLRRRFPGPPPGPRSPRPSHPLPFHPTTQEEEPMKNLTRSIAVALAAVLFAVPASAADEFITVDAAKALLGKPNVRFVYGDSEKEFEKGHIPGSVVAYAHDLHYLDDVKACKGLPMCEPTAAKYIGATLGIDAATEVVGLRRRRRRERQRRLVLPQALRREERPHPRRGARHLEGPRRRGRGRWSRQGGREDLRPERPVGHDRHGGRGEEGRRPTRPTTSSSTPATTSTSTPGKTLSSALASPGKEITVKRGGAIPTAVFSPGASTPETRTDRPTSPP